MKQQPLTFEELFHGMIVILKEPISTGPASSCIPKGEYKIDVVYESDPETGEPHGFTLSGHPWILYEMDVPKFERKPPEPTRKNKILIIPENFTGRMLYQWAKQNHLHFPKANSKATMREFTKRRRELHENLSLALRHLHPVKLTFKQFKSI